MFFNKSTCPLVLAVLLVAGFVFLAIPLTVQAAEITAGEPVLEVPDEIENVQGEPNTLGIQVYGIRGESVSFELTVTFQEDPNADPPVNTPVTGFDATDIELFAADSNDRIVNNGATASPVRSNADGSVYTTTITAKGNINNVVIRVPAEAAEAVLNLTQALDPNTTAGKTPAAAPLQVEIVRSAAPPLTLSPDRLIGGNAPFTVTLTSTTAITLARADLKVTGGSIDSLSSDTAKRVWTVTIRPGVGVAQITVEPSATGAYIFPKGTFTVDTAGPVATISGAPPIGGGAFVITIAFNEALQTGATLLPSEISVVGGSISIPIAIPSTNTYVTTLTPNPGVTTVTVQVNASAVADAGGIQNAATPSPAHTFTVAATGTPPGTGTAPRRGSVREITDGKVTISEIMFASGGGTNDIQWIELSNSSKTQAVALDAYNGWELIIENYNDPLSIEEPLSGTINFKDSGDVKTIPPDQTVLIVSSNGRNSGNTYKNNGRAHFVSTRVFSVYSEIPGEFGMSSRRDPFLHATKGFHIQLVDGRNGVADEVGNLDGRSWTTDEPAWKLPDGWTEDRNRTSIIRRYRDYNQRTGRYANEGTVHDGTRQDGWVRAVDTDFSWLSRKRLDTWYGSSSDYGSPGIHAGGELPVQLSHFRPERTESGAIVIHWTTQSEVDNAGFNILRSQTKTGEFKVVNAQLIPGAGTKAESTTYTWTDATAKPNVVYYYQIEDVSLAGERQTLATVRLRGFISAKGKLATQWGVLKQSRD